MSQIDSIQALLQEIDEVLQKTTPRLPWVMTNDAARQRQVLEQARAYLAELQLQTAEASETSEMGKTEINTNETAEAVGAATHETSLSQLPSGQMPAESAQQVLQSMLQEMNYLRMNMLQPMRSDVELLRQQREALAHEIRQLEAQRQQFALSGQAGQANPANSQLLMEFLQSAMAQLQENLHGQVVQMVASLSTSELPLLNSSSLSGLNLSSSDLSSTSGGKLDPSRRPASSEAIAALSPTQRLEQIQRVQTQSDQLLLKLDSTLRVIFESLQSNLQSYQDSLEQGLSRIHTLGQQGEAVVSALVTRLAEQVGREASSYLQSVMLSSLAPSEGLSANDLTTDSLDKTDAEIARLLEELNAIEPEQPVNPAALDTRWQPQPFALEAGSMAALSQELQQLDLSAIPNGLEIGNEAELTMFQTEPTPFNHRGFNTWAAGDDVAQIQAPDVSSLSSPEMDDLNSALDLLNQLGADIADTAIDTLAIDTLSTPIEATAESVSESTASESTAEPPMIASPEDLYEDEFYQSLFGDGTGDPSGEDLPKDPQRGESTSFSNTLDSSSLDSNSLDSPNPKSAGEVSNAEPSSASSPIQASSPIEDSLSDRSDHPDLFGGFSDPASDFLSDRQIQDAGVGFLTEFSEPTPPPDRSPQDLTQAMEDFLLSEPPSAFDAFEAIASVDRQPSSTDGLDDVTDETDLFWGGSAADEAEHLPHPAASVESEGGDTIHALTDLIPSGDLAGFGDDDSFEPAETSEDLLVLEEPQGLPIAELQINENTLQQLTADLSNLEQAKSPEQAKSLEQAKLVEPFAANQRSAADLLANEPEAASTVDSEPAELNFNAFTLEGVDELFESLPDAEPTQLNQPNSSASSSVNPPDAGTDSSMLLEELFEDSPPLSESPPSQAATSQLTSTQSSEAADRKKKIRRRSGRGFGRPS